MISALSFEQVGKDAVAAIPWALETLVNLVGGNRRKSTDTLITQYDTVRRYPLPLFSPGNFETNCHFEFMHTVENEYVLVFVCVLYRKTLHSHHRVGITTKNVGTAVCLVSGTASSHLV